MKTKKIKKEKAHKETIKKKPLLFQISFERRIETIVVLIAVLISAAAGVYYIINQYYKNGFFSFPLDDPWIHLQFAKNLIDYGSYSYYKNEVVTSGSTSPLYTFLAALLFLIFGNEFILSYVIGILFLGLLTYFCFILFKTEFNFSAGAAVFALLIAFQPKLGLISVSGMETTLFIFFLISTIYFYRSGKFLAAGIFSGLTLWTRPEGLILIAVLFFDLLMQKIYFKTGFAQKFLKEKNYIKFLIPLVLISAAYFIFNYILSGTILPNTYRAKIAYYFGQDRSFFLQKDILEYFSTNEFIIFPFLLLFALIFIIRNLVKKKYISSFFYLVFAVVFLLIYYFQLPTSHRFGRYLMPVIPFYLLIALEGLQSALSYFQSKSRSDQSFLLNFVYSVIIIIILGLSLNQIPKNASEIAFLGKYHYDRHINIGNWLRHNTDENEIIATHDIGALAFYSNRKIVDMVGLVNPEIIEYLRDKNSTDFLKNHLLKNNVSYFVTMRNWFEAVNQNPVYIPINEFEFFEVFKFEPEKFHIMPKEASEYNYRALLLLQNQNYRGALDFLMRSLRLDSKSSRTLYLIGTVYDLLKDYENAEIYLKRALEIFPDYPEARYELARIYYIKQDFNSAKMELMKALEIKPDFPEAMQFIISILENVEKNFDEAKKYRDLLSKFQ